MREIKFRAWHSGMKKMFSAEEMAEDQLTLLPTGKFINVHGQNTRLSTIFSHEQMLPEQFTGLRDKNGKEIYEGDVIEWLNLRFEITLNNHHGYRFMVGVDQINRAYAERSEIIGNIHENPELLENGGES
ncbi:MAG: hypothetical protein EHM45_06475 [Desulfobacteraceae bacterium]|nr:MAG: hypothetical protein EHM45_06475 [Desulfobacteraceae bacterium]